MRLLGGEGLDAGDGLTAEGAGDIEGSGMGLEVGASDGLMVGLAKGGPGLGETPLLH